MAEVFCRNAKSGSVKFSLNGQTTKLLFDHPPITIDFESTGVIWEVWRHEDNSVLLSWSGSQYDGWGTDSLSPDPATYDREQYPDEWYNYFLYFDLYKTVDGQEIFVARLPGLGLTDNPMSYIGFELLYAVNWRDSPPGFTVKDTQVTYRYFADEIPEFEVECDGCKPQECKGNKSRYPGYVCMDCKEMEAGLKRIGRKIDEQGR